jgi:hypothetical protein
LELSRKSFSHRSIYAALALSLLLGFAIALYIFSRFTTYTPGALRRAQENADFVVRLNVQQAVVHEPLKKFILPLLERGRTGPESRLKHLERKTTLELDVDVRELIYAEMESERFVIILAGFLRPDEVLDGVGRLLDDEGVDYKREGDLLLHPSGLSLAVADDGTLVFGSGPSEVRAALSPGPGFPSWAPPLLSPGVALGIYAAPRERGGGPGRPPSHLRGGTFVISADSYFPLDADVYLSGQTWEAEQVDALFASKSNDFGYLVPLHTLRFVAAQGPQFRARSNLGRVQFDEAMMRLSERIALKLNRALNSPSPTH